MPKAERDPILEAFDALGGGSTPVFPGRTKPFSQQPPPVVEPGAWDSTWRTVIYKGEARKFFLIAQFADALGRSVQSIRAWETAGKLPKSRYRTSPPAKGVGGGQPKGRRLWTREQIEGVIQIAKEEKVILNNGPAPTPAFTAKVKALFTELAKTDH